MFGSLNARRLENSPAVASMPSASQPIDLLAAREISVMNVFESYVGARDKNRKVFFGNFGTDFETFQLLLEALQVAWARIGRERDVCGASHVGLLPFANILTRHTVVGFDHLSSYQTFLAWLTFRPGLEALLMIGKFVDDPGNALIWKNRQLDWQSYKQTFAGRAIESKSLPQSNAFRQVLSRLNDEFMHPNPTFAYRDATQKDESNEVLLEIQCFDTESDTHEAHLLAYLNLLDLVVGASTSLVESLCGPSSGPPARGEYATQELVRATELAARNGLAKIIMEELGLWRL